MTSQSLITNAKKEKTSSLLSFMLKKYWTSIFLFTIILFFVIPVPVMMLVSEDLSHTSVNLETMRTNFATEWVEGIRYAIIPIMSILAVVIPCARFGYLKNKVSVDFFHSLPVKRERLFFIQLGVGAVALIIPYVVNVLFTLSYMVSNGIVSAALLVNLGMLTVELLVYSLFFYSMSTLIGMVSGLTAVQLVLTVIAIFILPLIQLVTNGFAYIFSENMWIEYYISEAFLEKLSPAVRFVFNELPLSLTESVVMVVLSILMLALALFLYLHRKSERAGQSVVFVPFGEVLKYIIMFIGTLGGGILFYAIMYDMFWTIFGMACGMVLTFMLTNTILNKTATAMFRGLKGLAIFGGAAIITLIILMTNAFGINSSVPSPKATSKIVVQFDNNGPQLEFTERDNIAAVHKIYTEGVWGYRGYPYDGVNTGEQFRLNVAFYNYLGIPTAKSVSIANKSNFMEEFRTILDSEEFREQYSESVVSAINLNSSSFYIQLPNYYINKHGRVWYGKDTRFYETDISYKEAHMYDKIAEYAKSCNFDYFQNPVFASIYFYGNRPYGYSGRLALLTSMEDVMYAYVDNGILPYDYEEQLRRLAKAIDKVIVYKDTSVIYGYDKHGALEITEYAEKSEPPKSVAITDKAQILQLLRASADALDTGYESVFTFADTEYYATFELGITNPLANECYDMSEVELQAYIKKNYDKDPVLFEDFRTFDIFFINGKTPDFVAGLFAE